MNTVAEQVPTLWSCKCISIDNTSIFSDLFCKQNKVVYHHRHPSAISVIRNKYYVAYLCEIVKKKKQLQRTSFLGWPCLCVTLAFFTF